MLPSLAAALVSPFYIDFNEFFIDSSNLLAVPYENVTAAFKTPISINSTAIGGIDWTQPYPGSATDGHAVYLEVAQEMLLSDSIMQNSTTVLSSLTFEVPQSMTSGGKPLAMDPSWYICRHIFVSTKPEVKQAVDGGSGCNFLPQSCRDDLKTSLTQDWGMADDIAMCSAVGFDPIPPSCQDSFGFARQDVIGFDASFIANTSLGLLETSKEQQEYSWRIGTGYHGPGDARSYALAANRTYLVATVWGYSRGVEAFQLPEVSFGCLSSGQSFVPLPSSPPSSTTTTASTSTSTRASMSSTTTTISSTPATPTPTQTTISNTIAFRDDFSSRSISQWKTWGGDFDASSTAMIGAKSLGGKALINSNFSNFLFEANFMLQPTDGNISLLFRASNPSAGADAYTGYYTSIAGTGESASIIIGRANNVSTQLGSSPAEISANAYHHIKVRAVNQELDVFVDDMSTAKLSVTDDTYSTGMNGLRVYDALALFDDIQISPLAFGEDFASGTMSNWAIMDGSFQVSSGAVAVSASPVAKALASGLSSTDFILEMDISIASSAAGSAENGGAFFRASNVKAGADSYNGYYAGLGGGYVVLGRVDSKWTELKTVQAADIAAGLSHHLMIRASGNVISVYVDDMNTPRIVVQDATYGSGLTGLQVKQTTMSVSALRVYAA